jgi:hypothetical protein
MRGRYELGGTKELNLLGEQRRGCSILRLCDLARMIWGGVLRGYSSRRTSLLRRKVWLSCWKMLLIECFVLREWKSLLSGLSCRRSLTISPLSLSASPPSNLSGYSSANER